MSDGATDTAPWYQFDMRQEQEATRKYDVMLEDRPSLAQGTGLKSIPQIAANAMSPDIMCLRSSYLKHLTENTVLQTAPPCPVVFTPLIYPLAGESFCVLVQPKQGTGSVPTGINNDYNFSVSDYSAHLDSREHHGNPAPVRS